MVRTRAVGLVLSMLWAGCASSSTRSAPPRPSPAAVSAPAPASSPPAADGIAPPPQCTAYEVAIYAIAGCKKLPAETRQALLQSYQLTKEAWASVPEEGRAALGEACGAAGAAIVETLRACT